MTEPQATSNDGYDVEETVVFKIYDMPQSLSARLLKYARERCGNKAWVAIGHLLDNAYLSDRLIRLEEKIEGLEGTKE